MEILLEGMREPEGWKADMTIQLNDVMFELL
jgi:hypothetical protein